MCRQSGSFRRGLLEKPGFSITLDFLAGVSRETGFPIRIIRLHEYRLKIDRLLTDISRYGTRALNIKKVLKTWDSVLMDNENLPEDWSWQSGVLVGIGKFRLTGWNC